MSAYRTTLWHVSPTGRLLSQLHDVIDRRLVAVNLHDLIPLLQAQRCHNELGQILGVSQIDQLIAGTWDCSGPVRDVDEHNEGREIGLDVWHAVVVEEQSVVELGPLEVRLAEDFETLFAKLIGCDLKRSGSVRVNIEISKRPCCHSLVFGCFIPPVALHEALDGRRLCRRLNQVALRLRGSRVVHNNGGHYGMDLMLVQDLSDLIDVAIVDCEGWDRLLSFRDLCVVSNAVPGLGGFEELTLRPITIAS
jgi:hypothetical protein